MLRVRVTYLESLRRSVEAPYGNDDENRLVAQVASKPFPPTPKMSAGSAWHNLLRLKQAPCPKGRFERGGFLWLAEDLIRARSITGPMPGAHEVPLERTCCVGGELVTVTGTLDYVFGSHVVDHKTTWKEMAAADYDKSLQWRLYLWLSGAEVFEYNLWRFTEPNAAGELDLVGHMAFRYHPYAELDKDCLDAVERFAKWATEKDLIAYLPRSKPLKAKEP